MAEKSKILIIGATGYFGKYIVEASAKAGHPTYALIRDASPSDPAKAKILDGIKSLGVTIIVGDLEDHARLVKVVKQVDVVISTITTNQCTEQVKLIAAIKEAGNIKKFYPAEFGNDVDRSKAVEPLKKVYDNKSSIRRLVEKEGIPYTYVACNFGAGYFLPTLAQFGTGLPRDKVIILGDGNTKAVISKEEDIATYTIKSVDDPQTLNKILYLRPPENSVSYNDLVALWEKKIGKTLEKIYVPEEQLLKDIEEGLKPSAEVPVPSVVLAVCHSAFVVGDHTNFEIDPSIGVEATKIYPDVKYTTVDEYLDQFA